MKLYISPMSRRDSSGALFARALFHHTGIRDWEMAAHPRGKPYLLSPPEAADIHFSISHSGAYWTVCFHTEPVGLDLQQHKGPCSASLADRYFHPEERAHFHASGDDPAVFYDLWCAKESYVKCTGNGIDRHFADFSVLHPPFPLRSLPFVSGYSLYVCARTLPEIIPEPVFLPEEDSL